MDDEIRFVLFCVLGVGVGVCGVCVWCGCGCVCFFLFGSKYLYVCRQGYYQRRFRFFFVAPKNVKSRLKKIAHSSNERHLKFNF